MLDTLADRGLNAIVRPETVGHLGRMRTCPTCAAVFVGGAKLTEGIAMATATLGNSFFKALSGSRLSEAERKRLTPNQLFHLALGKQLKLTQAEKDRLSPNEINHLALGRIVDPTTRDRSRLSENHLFHLALGRVIELDDRDRSRLSDNQIHHLTLARIL
jgi:hypothetical protein